MSKNKIPEIEAREVLKNYGGFNNQLLEWKYRFDINPNQTLTRSQSDYILKYHEVVPKVAKKNIQITKGFGETIKESRGLDFIPDKLWCEKLLVESDKAYQIYGRLENEEKNKILWIPKSAIILERKKLNKEIDYSPYDEIRETLPHQKEAIESLLANDKFILADDMGLGKGLPNNTLIYTPLGTKKMGEIIIGDKVIGSDGKPYNVIGFFPQGKKETYKITFNDGYTILTDDTHLWSVMSPNYSKNCKNDRNKKMLRLSTKQMFEGGKIEVRGEGRNKGKNYEIETYYKSPNGNNKWQIPIVQPIQFECKNELPIDPYLLGLGLGDGYFNKSGYCLFTVHEDDYYEMFNDFKLIPIKCKKNLLGGKIKLKEELSFLNLEHTRSATKFIPEIYKYSSIENRLALLQGLMDTDGYCIISKNGNFNGTEFSTISEKLCDDVCEIVQTLGGIARKKSRRSFYKKNGVRVECSISYRVNIKLPNGMNPFRLKRKADKYNEPKKYPVGRYIVNIEKHGEDYCTCISVDSPDKLYVAEHCIVTHNTTSAIIAALESGVKKILIICTATLKINWQREIEIYSNRKTLIMDGRKWGSSFDFYIVNYDILKNYHSLDEDKSMEYNLIEKENFDLVIIDEAHNISNPQAQRTKIVNDIIKKIPKVWVLTGTPMTSRPINFFNLLKIVKCPVADNWQHYVKRYCKGYQFTVNGKKIWKTDGASNLDELRIRTSSHILRRLKTEVLDLPDKIITPIYLKLESKNYDEELEEFIRITKEQSKKETINVSINRLMPIRQILSMEKIEATCELIDRFIENDKKVIVFTNFTNTIDTFQEKYGKKCVVLDGRMSKEKRQQSVDRFQNDPKVKIFFGNLKAAGVGITLTAAEGVIMNDLSFVPSDHSQAEDRAFRYGQKNNVLVYYPIFENTIEKIVFNILNKKKNIIDRVMGDVEYDESLASELFNSIL